MLGREHMWDYLFTDRQSQNKIVCRVKQMADNILFIQCDPKSKDPQKRKGL